MSVTDISRANWHQEPRYRGRVWARHGWATVRAAGLALAAVIVTAPLALAAREAAYTVAKYPVDAVAENAVKAKKQALASGRNSALRSLLKRIVPVTSYPMIRALNKIDATAYLDGVRVRSEENSATQYIATLDFTFRADLVRRLLRERGVPFVDKLAPSTQVVLAYGPPRAGTAGIEPDMASREGSELWRNVWAGLDLTNSVAPVTILSGSGGVKIPPPVINAIVRGDLQAVAEFVNLFGGRQVLFVYASPDPAGRRLNTTLAGRDAVGEFSLSRRYRLTRGDFAYSLELAAVISQGILEGRWKARMAPGAIATTSVARGPAEPITLFAEFNNLGQWQRQQQVIRQLAGVRDLQIGGISGRRAQVALRYPGGAPALSSALASQGVVLENVNGFWILR